VRLYFRELHRLGGAVRAVEYSMGMSGDFQTAVEEGATMVRIGTALFGPRSLLGAGSLVGGNGG
jgi:uncharacterized pyridoxal phosphate-containing UPF0001 family protein